MNQCFCSFPHSICTLKRVYNKQTKYTTIKKAHFGVTPRKEYYSFMVVLNSVFSFPHVLYVHYESLQQAN